MLKAAGNITRRAQDTSRSRCSINLLANRRAPHRRFLLVFILADNCVPRLQLQRAAPMQNRAVCRWIDCSYIARRHVVPRFRLNQSRNSYFDATQPGHATWCCMLC